MAVAGGLVILLIAVIVVGYRTYKYEQVSQSSSSLTIVVCHKPVKRCARDTFSFQQIIVDQTILGQTASQTFHISMHIFDLIEDMKIKSICKIK